MATMDKETAVVIRFQICIFDILNTALHNNALNAGLL